MPDLFDWADQPPAPATRTDQLLAAFEKFHRANPMVWEKFQELTFRAIDKGIQFYSAYAIYELIRWHVTVETTGDLKLNNNFRPYYSRLWALAHPDHADFFRRRRLNSEDRPAAENDVQVFDSGPADDSDRITSRLRSLL